MTDTTTHGETLFDAPAIPTEDARQWRIDNLQVVNWGGFHGHTAMNLDADATLIAGPSGSGKSTLLDAYLAVMMPDSTPFNGASNDAATGRARNPDQRNLLSYLRGKTDVERESDGFLRDQVLRGHGQATWGAVAATFRSDTGETLTALRVFLVKPSCTSDREITKHLCVTDGPFHLPDLQDAVGAEKFNKRVLKLRFPQLTVFDSHTAFAHHLYTRMGIGAHGDGDRAMRLLARIQGGYPVKRVDTLYKALVLEEPVTYRAADKALTHFQALEDAHQAMEHEEAKRKCLENIPTLHAEWADAERTRDVIDSLGYSNPAGPTPFRLWQLRCEQRLLANETAECAANLAAATDRHQAAQATLRHATTARDEAQRAFDGPAGQALRVLEQRGDVLADRLRERQAARNAFDDHTDRLGITVTSGDALTGAVLQARTWLDEYPAKDAEIGKRVDEAGMARYDLLKTQRALTDERESLRGREGRVPSHLHNARLAMAKAAGLDASDLPFVAELLDIAPGQQQWRNAIEVALGGITRIVLIDETDLDRFSTAIDGVRIRPRLNFEGVALRSYTSTPGHPDRVSGKVVHKDSPFSDWVAWRLRAANTDAWCVTDPRDLRGDGPRVTINGQTRFRTRGAHGQSDDPPIIGFSSADRIAEIAEQLASVEKALEEADAVQRLVEQERGRLRDTRDSWEYLLNVTWDSVDVETAEQELAHNRAERTELLASNSQLHTLEQQLAAAKNRHEESIRDEARTSDAVQTLADKHAQLQREHTQVTTAIEQLVTRVRLSDEQTGHLDGMLELGDGMNVAAFRQALAQVRSRLADQSKAAIDAARRTRVALEGSFREFHGKWPDPNLGTTIDSFDGYHAILTDILATGLHERREEWRRRLTAWSGEDLVPLHGAFESALETIEQRLLPVNDILRRLPFGARHDRLQITLHRTEGEDIKQFKRELRRLSSGVTATLSDEQVNQRFKDLQAFMARLRPATDNRTTNTRDYLLDVRRHVEITATTETPDGAPVAVYDSLGGKSGGETQELVAFIVGAALRFQLGDGDRPLPRFGPVFLDEGFVKSDSQFAGRSVDAWTGLGFQLIIGAPLDKVTALEPKVDRVYAVTKNVNTGHSRIHDITRQTQRETA
jgi:uncharacterized protein YPO0396